MASEWSNPNLCVAPPCPPAPCAPQQYQPLPISTGTVGIDRCGNIDVYAAPGVVHRQVCWPTCSWPIPYQGSWGAGATGGGLSGLANVLRAGAPMADWMLAQRKPPA